ncbi:N-acetyltransferase [Myroides sp. LoEW2-1]|uniref:N-acetyltransferase n=1 Tax=Myroides sp. LoEW2-1 TaxID=2683192 RepID=UPI001320D98F|nr:N-acetyltransferase [Myroides sp. LoEW2-1]MVX35480.1 N-acetyltransferase [Myroides sp. LoEW2-1]
MEIKRFSQINLKDPFFDSLKESYKEFEYWFNKKSLEDAKAVVHYDVKGGIEGFLYLKIEDEELSDILPIQEKKYRLKVGTFKINPHGTRLGERFIKKIMDVAIHLKVKEIYVTVFELHEGLISLLRRYGFEKRGTKTTVNGTELVLFKSMENYVGNVVLDYPLMKIANRRKFSLAIKPEYHSEMFPDSLLNNESYELIKDVTHTNSIHKIYVSYIRGINVLQKGDIVCIYRTNDGLGAAHYRSVITSICVVEEVKGRNDFNSLVDFINYANAYSVFKEKVLSDLWLGNRPDLTVIKMTYNIALSKRITKKILVEELGIEPKYWGFFSLTDSQFKSILDRGGVYENIIVN